MRILIDTNIVLDVLLRRTDFFDASYDVLKLSSLGNAEVYITANAVTDIYYILRRATRDAGKSKEAVIQLLSLVAIADALASDVMAALSSKVTDFEDALTGAIARRIKADCIVTRNTKDFTSSPVMAIDPKEFLAKISDINQP